MNNLTLPDHSYDYPSIYYNLSEFFSKHMENCPYNFTSNISEIVLPSNVYPTELAVPLYGYSLPFIVAVTGVANTLVVAVLIQKHMRSPTNILLLSISLSDLSTLILPAPMFFYMYTLGYHDQPLFPTSFCYNWYLFYDILPNTFHTASIWLTVALGIQRYIYVCHPPIARIYCSLQRVIKVVILIFMAAIMHQCPRLFEWDYIDTCVLWKGTFRPACTFYLANWVWNYRDTYYASYFLFRLLFVHLGPCTLLVILNSLLFRALKKAERKRNRLMKENRKKEYQKIRDSNCTTMMLIVILSIFLITEIPLGVITILHIMSSHKYLIHFSISEYEVIGRFIIVSNFFIILCYPINFAIYCGMSKKFLETFRETFCSCNWRMKKSMNASYNSGRRPSFSTGMISKTKDKSDGLLRPLKMLPRSATTDDERRATEKDYLLVSHLPYKEGDGHSIVTNFTSSNISIPLIMELDKGFGRKSLNDEVGDNIENIEINKEEFNKGSNNSIIDKPFQETVL